MAVVVVGIVVRRLCGAGAEKGVVVAVLLVVLVVTITVVIIIVLLIICKRRRRRSRTRVSRGGRRRTSSNMCRCRCCCRFHLYFLDMMVSNIWEPFQSHPCPGWLNLHGKGIQISPGKWQRSAFKKKRLFSDTLGPNHRTLIQETKAILGASAKQSEHVPWCHS